MAMNSSSQGCLYILATPIGNLSDLSVRAVEVLKEADALICEDTRMGKKLLVHLGISKRFILCHEHNEASKTDAILDELELGKQLVLTTDAGTPCISDPGFRLVRECHRRGLSVSPIPGPCAAITALSVSGMPTDGFLFVGFLPPKKAARKRFFEKYQDFDYTLVLYESTHRIEKFMNDLIEVMGPDRLISVGRELTKYHETILSGPVASVYERLKAGSKKGEFVVCIAKPDYSF